MHNHDDKYPSRLGFEPGTTRLQAPVDTKEPSGPASKHNVACQPRKHETLAQSWFTVGPTS